MPDVHEFHESLESYMRVEDDGGRKDRRHEMSRDLAKLSLNQVLLMEACDLAAIFSGCVGIKDFVSLAQVRNLEGVELATMLARHVAADQLVLGVRPGHPAERLFVAMAADKVGAGMYLEIALLLAEARRFDEVRLHLYLPPVVRGEKAAEAPLITADVDDDADEDAFVEMDESGLSVRDGSLDDDDDDDGDLDLCGGMS